MNVTYVWFLGLEEIMEETGAQKEPQNKTFEAKQVAKIYTQK